MQPILKILVPESIITVTNFLSLEECERYINLSERRGYEAATITTNKGVEMRSEIRNNSRVILDNLELANNLWQRIADLVPQEINIPLGINSNLIEQWSPIGLNERFRFYRYDRNQKFAPHHDGSYQRSEMEASKVTFMVYLNQEFTGGETKFDLHYPNKNLIVKPKTGMALCFLHYLRHQGAPVIEGTKYVLRSDVMYRQQIIKQTSSIFKKL